MRPPFFYLLENVENKDVTVEIIIQKVVEIMVVIVEINCKTVEIMS
ncbi:hypothetical protein METH109765_02675 [Mesobacillus thioparans]